MNEPCINFPIAMTLDLYKLLGEFFTETCLFSYVNEVLKPDKKKTVWFGHLKFVFPITS